VGLTLAPPAIVGVPTVAVDRIGDGLTLALPAIVGAPIVTVSSTGLGAAVALIGDDPPETEGTGIVVTTAM
jgi:hypothetical protein